MGVGDVGEPGTAESAADQVAGSDVGVRLVPGADLLEVFARRLVPHAAKSAFKAGLTPWVKYIGGAPLFAALARGHEDGRAAAPHMFVSPSRGWTQSADSPFTR